jgi:hypothetical protein
MVKKTRYQTALDLLKELHIKPSEIERDTGGAIPASWVRDMKTYNSGREYADRLDALVDYLMDEKDLKDKRTGNAKKEKDDD